MKNGAPMTDVLRDALERGAGSVETPDVPIDAVLAYGERRLRRRRLGAVGGTALAVALVIAAPAVVSDFRDEPRSVDRPGPVEPTKDSDPRPATRPIVYTDGSMLHVGSRTLDIGFTPPFRPPRFHTLTRDSLAALRVTDDGAVFATLDGRLWFSDGREMEQVGFVSGSTGSRGGWSFTHGRPLDWFQTDPAGSRAMWVEYPSDSRPELVLYDTAERKVQVRVPLPMPPRRRFSADWEVYGNRIYWRHHSEQSVLRIKLMRTSITTRLTEPATEAMLADERRLLGRTLVVGRGREARIVTDRDSQNFAVLGSRLEPVEFEGEVLNENVPVPLFRMATGDRLRFRAPASLQGVTELTLFQWLDDDRFVLSTAPTHQKQRRDIVVCRLSTERCEITERIGPGPWLVLPGAALPG